MLRCHTVFQSRYSTNVDRRAEARRAEAPERGGRLAASFLEISVRDVPDDSDAAPTPTRQRAGTSSSTVFASFASLSVFASSGASPVTMASLFGMSNGYEQVGETPAAFQPPGSRTKSNALDLRQLQEGIASAAQGIAAHVGAATSRSQPKMPEHHRPPDTNWDQKPGKSTPGASAFQSSFQSGTSGGFGPGGGGGPRRSNPYDDSANAPSSKESMNLGNRYAKSYSSSNPPPRLGEKASKSEDDEDGVAPLSFVNELGMDKEPSRKERRKKLQRIAEDPGILVDAASRGDISEIKSLVTEYDVPVDRVRVGGDGETPLQAAARQNQPEAVKTLMRLGADCETPDADGNRPLHVASSRGYAEVVRRLCKGKADTRAPGEAGATALHLACRKGREEVVGVLVEAGASLRAVDLKGWSPLHAAAAGGHEDIVEFLLEHGANPAAKDAKGKTAKSVAAKKGYEDIAKIIKKAIREKVNEEETSGSGGEADERIPAPDVERGEVCE